MYDRGDGHSSCPSSLSIMVKMYRSYNIILMYTLQHSDIEDISRHLATSIIAVGIEYNENKKII